MTPGLLDTKPQIVNITRVAPSNFLVFSRCKLRGVWSAARQPVLLPASPAARLGSVIHSLLAEAGAGAFAETSATGIERRWRELIYHIEQEMSISWLERHLVPLHSSVPNFEVRRIQVFNAAAQISASVPKRTSSGSLQLAATGFEVWVQSEDGLVGGFVDRIAMTAGGPVIQDYKSGAIFELEHGVSSQAVRESYVLQMKLYAALYAASTGQWPTRLELVALQGDIVQVPFDHSACVELLNQARMLVQETNHVISTSSSSSKTEERLATPDPSICANCLYRPACNPYHEARQLSIDSKCWPNDIRGVVSEIRRLGNGTFLLNVKDGQAAESQQRVRSLSQSRDRHPAISQLSPGDPVGLYNLRSSGATGTFNESPLTTIYKLQ